jgi:endonuclease/exonuclease/phosphatase (EEP) superfamily protein YafD
MHLIEPDQADKSLPQPLQPPPQAMRLHVRAVLHLLHTISFLLLAGVFVIACWLIFAFSYPQNLREAYRPLMLLNCIAFAGQVLHLHLGLALLPISAMAIFLRRWRLAGFAAGLALAALLPAMWSYRLKNPPPIQGEPLRIASVNVLFSNRSPKLLSEFDRIDADILLVQEWHEWHEKNVTPALNARYPHQLRFADARTQGMAIFSKVPFEDFTPAGTDHRLGPNGLRLQRIVLEHEGRGLVIYNIHPVAPAKLGRVVWGQRQVAELIDAVGEEVMPYILAGDFNATPLTANLQAIRKLGLTEVHSLAGRGPGLTWTQKGGERHLPGVRIDHIFIAPQLTASDAQVGRYHGSDHLSVFADIGWRERQ